MEMKPSRKCCEHPKINLWNRPNHTIPPRPKYFPIIIIRERERGGETQYAGGKKAQTESCVADIGFGWPVVFYWLPAFFGQAAGIQGKERKKERFGHAEGRAKSATQYDASLLVSHLHISNSIQGVAKLLTMCTCRSLWHCVCWGQK